ncbi:MAG TPA: TIGR04282 family arsenosugar biosynthesis glycosyltransferase [Rubrivivax sp.]|nr:TIGR04282 family arsenosugar biosynthesis glycosyltransferase [Rubrivivax sp.]
MKAAASTVLIVFAKAPVAGQAKTRLMPALGAAGAAELAARLLERAVAAGMSAGFDVVELCAAPDASHPTFGRLAARHAGLQLSVQGDGDLGARMHRALTRRLVDCGRVLLIGTDAPALDAAALRTAAQALAGHDAVFVPALDGGYALVGLSRPQPDLFTGMPWSTPRVMAETRERARRAGLRWAELPAVADIDEPADLIHLPAEWLP